jgi:hypothetical protein
MPEQIEVPTLPEVRIIQNGKPVDTSAIDNYDNFMTFAMVAAQTSHLAKIRKHLEDTASVGEIQNWELDLTPTPQEIICAHPSQSIWLVNDGPGDIFVAENALGRIPTHLHIHDEMWDDFKVHRLFCFYAWSAPGTVATARAKVKY